MKQLSVRGFGPELSDALKELTEKGGISLSQAALRLMRLGAGITGGTRSRVGNRLDEFVGTMSDDEVLEFRRSTVSCAQVDESFWK